MLLQKSHISCSSLCSQQSMFSRSWINLIFHSSLKPFVYSLSNNDAAPIFKDDLHFRLWNSPQDVIQHEYKHKEDEPCQWDKTDSVFGVRVQFVLHEHVGRFLLAVEPGWNKVAVTHPFRVVYAATPLSWALFQPGITGVDNVTVSWTISVGIITANSWSCFFSFASFFD